MNPIDNLKIEILTGNSRENLSNICSSSFVKSKIND